MMFLHQSKSLLYQWKDLVPEDMGADRTEWWVLNLDLNIWDVYLEKSEIILMWIMSFVSTWTA